MRIEDRDVSNSNLTAPTEKSHYEFFVTVIRQPLSAGHEGFCNNFRKQFWHSIQPCFVYVDHVLVSRHDGHLS